MDVQVLSKTVFTGQYDTIPVIKKVAATAEVVKRTVTLSHFDCQGGSRAVSKMSPIEQDVHVVCDIYIWRSGGNGLVVWRYYTEHSTYYRFIRSYCTQEVFEQKQESRIRPLLEVLTLIRANLQTY